MGEVREALSRHDADRHPCHAPREMCGSTGYSRVCASTPAFWCVLSTLPAMMCGTSATALALLQGPGAWVLSSLTLAMTLPLPIGLAMLWYFGCTCARDEGGDVQSLSTASLAVDIHEVDSCPGAAVGMSCSPGRRRRNVRRDLVADVIHVQQSRFDVIFTLLEPREMRAMRISDLGATCAAHGLQWRHFAIRDKWVPRSTSDFVDCAVYPLVELLRDGKRVLVHCNGGKGRTGLLVACALHSLRTDPRQDVSVAVRAMRASRPGMLRNPLQQVYLRWLSFHGILDEARAAATPRRACTHSEPRTVL